MSHPSIPPKSKTFKKFLIKILLFFVGRGMQSASKYDPDVKKEIEAYPDNLTITMNILPNGSSMTIQKQGSALQYIQNVQQPDLTISFKNIESAFMVLTAQIGTPQAYAEHRISVKGNVTYAVIFTRCMKILQGYLFIGIINKRIMKRLPPMPLKKQLIRIYIYTIGIPFGR